MAGLPPAFPPIRSMDDERAYLIRPSSGSYNPRRDVRRRAGDPM